MDKQSFRIILFVMLTALLGACATRATPQTEGPGMIVTFNGNIEGRSIDFVKSVTSSGSRFPNPGSVGGRRRSNPMAGGATMGGAPDGRELPEWVEFEWKEWPYPYPPMPTELVARQAWNEGVDSMSRSLPHKTARVAVRSRVPQDVIDEVIESNRRREPRKLSDKMLWVYFIWYEDGIKFRWELVQGCCKTLREGGDELPK